MHFVNDIHEPEVAVDIEIVLQVFENLMSNAARYAKSEVSVICKTLNNHLLITVSDDGCGFDVKDIKIATDPFYTTEKKSEGEHFGLGLGFFYPSRQAWYIITQYACISSTRQRRVVSHHTVGVYLKSVGLMIYKTSF